MEKVWRSKTEAATFLGVCPRSLERYTRQGKISAKYERGRTKPVPLYAEADLAALKAELEATAQSRPKSASTNTLADPICFRLAPEHMKQLEEHASMRGMGRNAYARLLVLGSLLEADSSPGQNALAELRDLFRVLGEDMASATFALLIHAGQIKDETEAREWVRMNLKAKEL